MLEASEKGTGERFEHYSLPALAIPGRVDPLSRAPGEALWPERYDEAELATIRESVGSRVWTGEA